jgi:hypothetical protein
MAGLKLTSEEPTQEESLKPKRRKKIF